LLFAWRVAKFVKSNAIVFCAGAVRSASRGPNEPRRRRRLAVLKAQDADCPSRVGRRVGRFFPFQDAWKWSPSGAKAVIQPAERARHE